MKFIPLIWAGLWRKPLRTTLTMLALVVAFLLFGILQGISAGFEGVVASSKLDRLFTDPRFGAPLPLAYGEQIAQVPGVRLVAPGGIGLGGYYQEPKNGQGVVATDERFFEARDELTITKEQLARWRSIRNGLVVGPGLVKRFGVKVGDQFPIHSNLTKRDGSVDWAFEIVAVVDDVTAPGELNFAIANYEFINEARADGKDNISRFLIRIDNPNRATQVSRAIDKLFANSAAPTRTQSDRIASQSNLSQVGDINFFVNAIVGSVLFMLLFMTANSMMQSFRERVPEFAVLKTIGFGNGGLFALVLSESAFQYVLAGAVGLGLAKLAAPVGRGRLPVPPQALEVPWSIVAAGIVVAVILALISGLMPALRARRLDIVDALAGR